MTNLSMRGLPPTSAQQSISALRVADTSILPAVPSRGTFNAAVFIGEFIAHQMSKTR
jgi:hypothetical protein